WKCDAQRPAQMLLELAQPVENLGSFQLVEPEPQTAFTKPAIDVLEFLRAEPAAVARVTRIERDPRRHRLAVRNLEARQQFELVRRPVPEIERPRLAELKRIAAGADALDAQRRAADDELPHRL